MNASTSLECFRSDTVLFRIRPQKISTKRVQHAHSTNAAMPEAGIEKIDSTINKPPPANASSAVASNAGASGPLTASQDGPAVNKKPNMYMGRKV